jgi:hypothetical protein
MKKCASCLFLMVSMVVLLSLESAGYGHEDHNPPGRWEQRMLFMLEDAYNQHQGEFEVSLTSEYLKNMQTERTVGGVMKTTDRTQWNWIVDGELGITDWLQAEVEVPFGYTDMIVTNGGVPSELEKGDIGDVFGGLTLRLLQQNHHSWGPTVGLRAGGRFPTGEWERGLGKDEYGWEAGLVASKAFDDFYWHANASYGQTDKARQYARINPFDETLVECGFALVYSPHSNYELICETVAIFAEEDEAGALERTFSWYVIPGLNLTLTEGFDVSVGAPIGVDGDTYEWGVIAKTLIKLR